MTRDVEREARGKVSPRPQGISDPINLRNSRFRGPYKVVVAASFRG